MRVTNPQQLVIDIFVRDLRKYHDQMVEAERRFEEVHLDAELAWRTAYPGLVKLGEDFNWVEWESVRCLN